METLLLLKGYRKLPPLYSMVSSPTPYDLPFSQNTARLAFHSSLWLFKVIQGQWFTCQLKAKMRLSISDHQQPRPYIAPFSHNTSLTNRRRRVLDRILKYSRLK